MLTFLFSLWEFMSACVWKGRRDRIAHRERVGQAGLALICEQWKQILTDYTEETIKGCRELLELSGGAEPSLRLAFQE